MYQDESRHTFFLPDDALQSTAWHLGGCLQTAKDWSHKAEVSFDHPQSEIIKCCVWLLAQTKNKISSNIISKALCNWLFCHFSWAASAAETCGTFRARSILQDIGLDT